MAKTRDSLPKNPTRGIRCVLDGCPRNTPELVPDEARGPLADEIEFECDAIKALLVRKNAQYGNSALEPVRVFSRADTVEQIKVRIDDKLSRLARGVGEDEDVVADLLGYLILLKIAQKKARTP